MEIFENFDPFGIHQRKEIPVWAPVSNKFKINLQMVSKDKDKNDEMCLYILKLNAIFSLSIFTMPI